MCVQSQPYSRLYHSLLSAYGSRWADRDLLMFTVFVDDSGTDPNQKVAIASALLVPGKRFLALEQEWENLKEKESFECFHSSEAIARNPKSEFAKWDDGKLDRVLSRVRGISKKYGTRIFSLAVNKADYDDAVHPELKEAFGRYHYTWAVRSVVQFFAEWSDQRSGVPIEYIFDFMGSDSQKQAKSEIETVMKQAELLNPGRFAGHYSFRNRCELPSLQCTDLIAWSCYKFALHKYQNVPLNQFAKDSFEDCESKGDKWFVPMTSTRQELARWSAVELADPLGQQRRLEWKEGRSITPNPKLSRNF